MEEELKHHQNQDNSNLDFIEAFSKLEPDSRRKKLHDFVEEESKSEWINLAQNRIEQQNKQMVAGSMNEPMPLFPQVISFMSYNQAKDALRVSMYVNDLIQTYQDKDDDDVDHDKFPKYHYKKAYVFQNEINKDFLNRQNLLLTASDMNSYAQNKNDYTNFSQKIVTERENEDEREYKSEDEEIWLNLNKKRILKEKQDITYRANQRRMYVDEYIEKIVNRHHGISILSAPALHLMDELKEYVMIRIFNLGNRATEFKTLGDLGKIKPDRVNKLNNRRSEVRWIDAFNTYLIYEGIISYKYDIGPITAIDRMISKEFDHHEVFKLEGLYAELEKRLADAKRRADDPEYNVNTKKQMINLDLQ